MPAMIYPAGTFVLGTSDVISLDAMYDSTDLIQNMYTAAFAEDGWLLLHQCYDGCLITLPVCISGQTGAPSFEGCASVTYTPPVVLGATAQDDQQEQREQEQREQAAKAPAKSK
jgi:hypothetical protein